jgi:hypothetical protein
MPSPIMKYFAFEHLPKGSAVAAASVAVFELACSMEATIPDSAEKFAGLRKLLEAKDCFVRAALPPE